MLNGVLQINGKQITAVLPETHNERLSGLDFKKIDGAMVFLYCCPSYVIFRGCQDRPIDIAFCKREGNLFKPVKIISSLQPGEVCSMDKIECVIEAEAGSFYKFGLVQGVDTGVQIFLQVNGLLRNVAEFYEQKKEGQMELKAKISEELERAGITREDFLNFLSNFKINKEV